MASKNLIKITALLLLFATDRLIKNLMILKLPEEGVLLLPGVSLKLYLNQALAFSLPVANWLAAVLSIVVLLVAVGLLSKHAANKPLGQWGLGLLIIGSVSNLIDRIFYGGVIDWLQLGFWPTFNLSDFYIFLACLFLLAAVSSFKFAGRKQ